LVDVSVYAFLKRCVILNVAPTTHKALSARNIQTFVPNKKWSAYGCNMEESRYHAHALT
jgi:hypothetical protein